MGLTVKILLYQTLVTKPTLDYRTNKIIVYFGYIIKQLIFSAMFVTKYFNRKKLLFKFFKTYLLISISFVFLSLTVKAQSPQWQWAYAAGAGGSDYGNDIYVDTAGNVYVTGTYKQQITFGETTLTSAGSSDIFLVKYNSAGSILWAKSFGDDGLDDAESLFVDASGNVFLTGSFASENLTFGNFSLYNPNTLFGYDQFFLVKIDASGSVLWAKTSDGMGNMVGNSVTVDRNGNIIVTGWFDGSNISFGSFTLTNTGALATTVFIVKYNNTGTPLWAKATGDDGYDVPSKIVYDANGNLFITGFFEYGAISFGSTTLSNSGGRDIFIAKYDVSGNALWAKSAMGIGDEYGNNIVVDADNNIVVTGTSSSESVTFDSAELTGNNYDKIFIVKYNASGDVVWTNVFSGDNNDESSGLTIDTQGNMFLCGYFKSNSIHFESTELINSNSDYNDFFITKLDVSGNVIWAKSGGGSNDDEAIAVAIDGSGNAYLTGNFYSSTIDFDGTTLTNSDNSGNSTELFVAKLNNSSDVNGQTLPKQILAYPNPASQIITIKGVNNSYVSLYNCNGKLMKLLKPDKKNITIDISEFVSGVYFIKTIKQNTTTITKLIKK